MSNTSEYPELSQADRTRVSNVIKAIGERVVKNALAKLSNDSVIGRSELPESECVKMWELRKATGAAL